MRRPMATRRLGNGSMPVGHKALERFGVRRSATMWCASPHACRTIRTLLIRVDPAQLDRALQRWHQQHAGTTRRWPSTARRCATRRRTRQAGACRMSVVGHHTKATYTQKKSASSATTTRQTHQRDRHRHSAPRPTRRHQRQDLTVPMRLLTQRTLAPTSSNAASPSRTTSRLALDIALQFVEAKHTPDFEETPTLAHGRIEQRAIKMDHHRPQALYADFPGVGQVFGPDSQKVRQDQHRNRGASPLTPPTPDCPNNSCH